MNRVRLLETSDPDQYTIWANAYVFYPRGQETDGPARLDRVAYASAENTIIRYFPPSADELAEAVTKEAT